MNLTHPLLQRSARILPWVGLAASVAMAFVVTLFGALLLPQFVEMFGSAGQALPWISRVYSQGYLLAWLAPALVGVCWYFGPPIAGRILAGLLGLGAGLLGSVGVLFAMYLPYFMLGSLV
ncbi:hypothetical protein [Stenotrophomonas bentonitica]